jgi:hypothetical protein
MTNRETLVSYRMREAEETIEDAGKMQHCKKVD